MELSKYSTTAGVFIWTVYPREIPGCLNIKLPLELDRGKQIEYDFDLGSRALETLKFDLEHNKPKALDYRKSYLMRYLPPEKWWKQSSISGINIRMGLQDGDPSKPYTLRFDRYAMCRNRNSQLQQFRHRLISIYPLLVFGNQSCKVGTVERLGSISQ